VASPPAGDRRAAQRYGRLVDPIARQYTNPLTGKPLSGAALLLKLASGESGFASNRTSTAGAKGRTQFTPGSRATAISKFGVDPWRSTDEAYHAAALHLLGKINGSKGLEGYNPGMASYPSYILNQRVGASGARGSGSFSSGGGGATVALPDAGGSAGADLSPGADVSGAVAALLSGSRSSAPPISGPAAPAYSARAALPQGYAAPSSGGPAVQDGPDIGALLDAVRTRGGDLPGSGSSGAGGGRIQASGGTSGPVPVASGRSPVVRKGKIIGTPYSGTHTLGNWQSDNADDIAVPAGTPMVAVQDGVIVKVRHHPQDGSRFAGDQVTVRGRNGNEYFYAHGVASVRPGQRVRKGQQLGVTGSANGVEHLHFGQRRGNPGMHAGR
jgi:hypothetical protein